MARNFNGSSDKIVNSTVAAVSGPPVTFAAWVRPDVVNADKRILGCYNTTSSPLFGILMSSTGKAQCQWRADGGATSNAVGTTTLSTTAFQHIAGTITSDGRAEIFYAGASEAAGSVAGGTITLSRTQIGVIDRGAGGAAAQFWDGDVAETAIWSAVLDDDEIAALAKGYPAHLIRPVSLVFYAPLIRDVLDLKGIALTTTGTTVSDHSRRLGARKRGLISRAAAGAGTTYNDTLSESVAVADSLATIATFPNALTESITPADSYASAVTWGCTLTEALSLLDGVDASGSVFGVTLSEAIALADAYSASGGQSSIWVPAASAGGTWAASGNATGTWTPLGSASGTWTPTEN